MVQKWLTDSDGPYKPNKFDEELLPVQCLPEMTAKDQVAELAGDLSALTVNCHPASYAPSP